MAPLNKAAHLMMGPPPDSHSQLHYNRDSQDSSSGPRLVASPHVNLVTPRGRFPFPHSARRPIFFIAEYGPQRCMATPQQCPVPAGPHDGMDAPPPPREVPPPPQIPAHPAPLPDPIPTNKGVDTKEVEEDTPLPPSSTSNGGAQVESEKLTVSSHALHQLEPPLEKEELPPQTAPPTLTETTVPAAVYGLQKKNRKRMRKKKGLNQKEAVEDVLIRKPNKEQVVVQPEPEPAPAPEPEPQPPAASPPAQEEAELTWEEKEDLLEAENIQPESPQPTTPDKENQSKEVINMDAAVEDGGDLTIEINDAAKVKERLQKRHQARLEDAERRKKAKDSSSVVQENQHFSSVFYGERSYIEQLLSECYRTDRAEATRRLEEATNKVQWLWEFLNDNFSLLTQYNVREAQAALQKLQSSLSKTIEECLPRKKFKFSHRTRTKASEKAQKAELGLSNTPEAESGNASAPPAREQCGISNLSNEFVTKTSEEISKQVVLLTHCNTPEAESGNASAPPTREQCGISNLSNEFVTKTSEEISKHVVLLTHLTHCKVRLFGSPSTVHLKHIEDCEILCGPVASSVLIDHCTNSTLAFPCQQLRIHNTTNTQVYVHVTSRAIVENCSRVGFAPFTWSYPRLEEDFCLSGLDKDRNNWNLVDDCNWLETGTPSPNWTVITEGERKNNWDP
ncbi:tubulin-specific chaperone C-like isoform X2 [Gouania willdenowi]|nr:tubulin-specific chaperone C-like isoform X2 [Gouania willdenowi]